MAQTLLSIMNGTDLSKGSPNPYIPLGVHSLRNNPLFRAMSFLKPSELDPMYNGSSTRVTQTYMTADEAAKFRKTFTDYTSLNSLPQTNDLFIREIGGKYMFDSMVERGFKGNKIGADIWDRDQMECKIDAIKRSFERAFIKGSYYYNDQGEPSPDPNEEIPPNGIEDHIRKFGKLLNHGKYAGDGFPPKSQADAIRIQGILQSMASKFVDGKPNFIITNQNGADILTQASMWANQGIKTLTYKEGDFDSVFGYGLIVLESNNDFMYDDTEFIMGNRLYMGAPIYMARIGDTKRDVNCIMMEDGKLLDIISPLDYTNADSVKFGKVTMAYTVSFGSVTCVRKVIFGIDIGPAPALPVVTREVGPKFKNMISQAVADIRYTWNAMLDYTADDGTRVKCYLEPVHKIPMQDQYFGGKIVYQWQAQGETEMRVFESLPSTYVRTPNSDLVTMTGYNYGFPYPPQGVNGILVESYNDGSIKAIQQTSNATAGGGTYTYVNPTDVNNVPITAEYKLWHPGQSASDITIKYTWTPHGTSTVKTTTVTSTGRQQTNDKVFMNFPAPTPIPPAAT